jgi:hypothetical protein
MANMQALKSSEGYGNHRFALIVVDMNYNIISEARHRREQYVGDADHNICVTIRNHLPADEIACMCRRLCMSLIFF